MPPDRAVSGGSHKKPIVAGDVESQNLTGRRSFPEVHIPNVQGIDPKAGAERKSVAARIYCCNFWPFMMGDEE
jgi:hypothetical protein